MAVFPLLADPATYEANMFDLIASPEHREAWVAIFDHQIENIIERSAVSEGGSEDAWRRAKAAGRAFREKLQQVMRDPQAFRPLHTLKLCEMREECLRAFQIADPFRPEKDRETDAALKLLPDLLKEIDATDPSDRLETLIRGVFAGNIFDLGASATIDLYKKGELDFRATRQKLKPRPWLVDGLDALKARWQAQPHRRAVVFIDNAGPDVVLGMIPFCRELLRRGTQVVITANSAPALNDVTYPELIDLIDKVAACDPVIAEAHAQGQLELIPSGNGAPLIDLARVSEELVAACDGVDLVVLEGMGRGLESNYTAQFTCESLKLAMLKEPMVARWLGGGLYDVVCRYETGTAPGVDADASTCGATRD